MIIKLNVTTSRKLRDMRRLIASTVLALGCALLAAAQNAPPDPVPFLVSIHEQQMDLSPTGVTSSSCIVVQPDGRFHLERRRQQLPKATATLKIFESSLNSAQLQQLRDILNDESITKLPPFVQPAIPMTVPWVQALNAKIGRGREVHSVGYWVWRGGTPEGSPNSTPDNIKKAWQGAAIALRPLVEWFHEAEAMKLDPSNAKSTLCSTSEDPENTNGAN
jgi:hypothetical protein